MLISDAAKPAVVVNLVFTSLAVLIVSMRLCTRAFLVKNIGLDDVFIALAMVGSPVTRIPA